MIEKREGEKEICVIDVYLLQLVQYQLFQSEMDVDELMFLECSLVF